MMSMYKLMPTISPDVEQILENATRCYNEIKNEAVKYNRYINILKLSHEEIVK